MRNVKVVLSELLNEGDSSLVVALVEYQVGADLWLVKNQETNYEKNISGSGLNIGDYVLHKNGKLHTNLGPVEFTTALV